MKFFLVVFLLVSFTFNIQAEDKRKDEFEKDELLLGIYGANLCNLESDKRRDVDFARHRSEIVVRHGNFRKKNTVLN